MSEVVGVGSEGVILESDRGRLSWIIVRMKANED